jgi:1,4-alpha-glucan branching enzyme
MPASQAQIGPNTPMGANLVADGATFRVWAPRALDVFVAGEFNAWRRDEDCRLVQGPGGYWAGFIPGVQEGQAYKFWVVGQGSSGYKRDPYARELATDPAYPHSNCIIRNPAAYPWHDQGFRPPAFNDLIIYEFHVGTFYGPNRAQRVATFLDVLDRLDYLVALGVNAIETLPIVEYENPRSMGYDGSDLFAPEMEYTVGPTELATYLPKVNALLARQGQAPLTSGQLAPQVNQLKIFIDLCHLYGLAVILDVVYNHAGGAIKDVPDVREESLYFFDRWMGGDPNDSLYFTDQVYTGPVFAYWKQEVRQFLIDNAAFFVREYHVDGFRYDQVSAIVQNSASNGWSFCQDLTDTIRAANPSDPQISEYWNVDPWVVRSRSEGGAGFDATWHDGLRGALRTAVAQASQGQGATLDFDAIAGNLYPPGFPAAWKAVTCVEDHDLVYQGHPDSARIVHLADPGDARSWYARSRARFVTGVLLTAPGIPMLFMGQELLEDKLWSDNPGYFQGTLIWWEGLEGGQKPMVDFLRFTQDLIALRKRQPALRGEPIRVFHVHNANRVIAFHRWLESHGRDVVVVATLNESTYYNYTIGFPAPGRWLEVFNSDVYDNWVNPIVAGNGGSLWVDGPPLHGFATSAAIVIPANGVLVFARDAGD